MAVSRMGARARTRHDYPARTTGSADGPAGTIVRKRSANEGGPTKPRLAAFGVALVGSALLGIVAGLIWGAVAPRALLQEVGRGQAQFVNVETSA